MSRIQPAKGRGKVDRYDDTRSLHAEITSWAKQTLGLHKCTPDVAERQIQHLQAIARNCAIVPEQQAREARARHQRDKTVCIKALAALDDITRTDPKSALFPWAREAAKLRAMLATPHRLLLQDEQNGAPSAAWGALKTFVVEVARYEHMTLDKVTAATVLAGLFRPAQLQFIKKRGGVRRDQGIDAARKAVRAAMARAGIKVRAPKVPSRGRRSRITRAEPDE